MTQDATARWELPLLHAGQAQKELFHNEALARIDMLLHAVVQSADLAVPPAAPAIGQCWIVATGASGAWDDQDGAIAGWTQGGWRFVQPRAGMAIGVADRGHALVHDGVRWQGEAVRADGLYVSGDRVVGAQAAAIADPTGGTVIDEGARGTISTILAAMRDHGLIAR